MRSSNLIFFSYQNKAFFPPLWHTRFIRKRGNLMEQFLEDIKDLEEASHLFHTKTTKPPID